MNLKMEQDAPANEPIRLVVRNRRREPQLTDEELVRLRRMMEAVEQVHGTCPMARGLLGEA